MAVAGGLTTPMQHVSAKSDRQRVLVVVISMYLIMIANGALLLLVVGLKQIAEEFGWPRGVPSLAYAFLFIGSGLGGIVMGYWYDRSGAGPVTLVGAVMLGSGAILSSMVEAQWQLYLIYGLMMGFLGQATIYGPLVVNVMTWFEDRRGFAIGLITAGQGIAGALWPPMFRHFNETAGWQETFFWFGVFALFTAVPATFVLRRRKRGTTVQGAQSRGGDPTSMTKELGIPVWLLQGSLCLAIFCCCVSISMPLAHLVAHASDLGHATARGAEMLAMALVAATVVRLIGGSRLVDRFGGLVALVIFSATQAGGVALYAVVDGLAGLYLVSMLFGFGYGGISICYPVIVREYLPSSQSGRWLGVVLLFGAFGMAVGGWLAGFVFDHTGSYPPAFLIGFGFNVMNLVVVMTLINRTRGPRLQPSMA